LKKNILKVSKICAFFVRKDSLLAKVIHLLLAMKRIFSKGQIKIHFDTMLFCCYFLYDISRIL